MKNTRNRRRLGALWHKARSAFRVAAMIAAPVPIIGCTGNESAADAGAGGSGTTTTGSACCAAACIPRLGFFSFKSDGKQINVWGHATITDADSGKVLLDEMLSGAADLGSTGFAETALLPYEGKSFTARVDVNALGYPALSKTFPLDVQRQTICCGSCLTATGGGDLELGAPPTPTGGCMPTPGMPNCPTSPPFAVSSCPAELTCCGYQAMDATPLGCTCQTDGWHCVAAACTCP